MPPKKTTKATPTKKRAQSVAVRIVQAPPKIKPAEPELTEAKPSEPIAPPAEPKKAHPLTPLRLTETIVRPKTYVWLGVGASFILIIVAWVFFIRYFPTHRGPNAADQTLMNIGKVVSRGTNDLKAQADKLKNSLSDAPTPQQLEIQALDQKVFPEFYR